MKPMWFVERVFVPIEEQYKYLSELFLRSYVRLNMRFLGLFYTFLCLSPSLFTLYLHRDTSEADVVRRTSVRSDRGPI